MLQCLLYEKQEFTFFANEKGNLLINENIMKKLLIIVFIVLLAACSEDDNGRLPYESYLKQGWQLSLMSINNVEVDLSVIPLSELMYLTDQQLCYLAIPENNGFEWSYLNVRSAWSYDPDNDILNIAAVLPVTYYIDKLDVHNLGLHYYMYNTSGGIDFYKKTFRAVNIEVKNQTIRLDE